ncbi:methanogenesis marker 16 metalloprotein [Candidatus Methanocrinis natronophilus]|uniref:Methanogenesis marker 16 metalloprotein n=1 Tax=Candidatus Methanocrinis natronophilus TaxID=3033396 RepID=A0ABT5X752_9EURY|nr:methanogenesis marker 16 metalloprotein [Candidatus Methanocrinis natronophilus]MDF0590522.1 methanogenesis marker 16 metalloprotein [Candidatus Methanocrinis natronophilus]
MSRTLSEIQAKVDRGEAVVLTAKEVGEILDGEVVLTLEDVDVVTCATRAVMSGTYAVFSFPVAPPGTFRRATGVWLNGVPAVVGPCPNERLGVLDLIVFGTAASREESRDGGGHLFRDLVEGEEVRVEVETEGGGDLDLDLSLADMPTARLFGTRHSFKNYSAFVNPSEERVATIFHATTFDPCWRGASVSGCGRLNPLENDPLLDTIGVGTRVLINGAEGFVLGRGTRSSPDRPNLSGYADMHGMDPEYMGGFRTSAGPECISSWAVAIPVLREEILERVAAPEEAIPLPVMDVVARKEIGQATYADVWEGTDLAVSFEPGECKRCTACRPEAICPTGAIGFKDWRPTLDRRRCFNCGLCATSCAGDVFRARLGSLRFAGREVPIVVRQSDRLRAERLAEELKRRIVDGSFRMTEMAERISP